MLALILFLSAMILVSIAAVLVYVGAGVLVVEIGERKALRLRVTSLTDFPRPMSHARRITEAGRGTEDDYVPDWAQPL